MDLREGGEAVGPTPGVGTMGGKTHPIQRRTNANRLGPRWSYPRSTSCSMEENAVLAQMGVVSRGMMLRAVRRNFEEWWDQSRPSQSGEKIWSWSVPPPPSGFGGSRFAFPLPSSGAFRWVREIGACEVWPHRRPHRSYTHTPSVTQGGARPRGMPGGGGDRLNGWSAVVVKTTVLQHSAGS